MDTEHCSTLVAEEAAARARRALARRRPDLGLTGEAVEVPGAEQAQVALDTLTFVREAAERLHSDLAGHVLDARGHGASWARIGVALGESPQTAFNRYRHLEATGPEPSVRPPERPRSRRSRR